jgi:hypothetical protein
MGEGIEGDTTVFCHVIEPAVTKGDNHTPYCVTSWFYRVIGGQDASDF